MTTFQMLDHCSRKPQISRKLWWLGAKKETHDKRNRLRCPEILTRVNRLGSRGHQSSRLRYNLTIEDGII